MVASYWNECLDMVCICMSVFFYVSRDSKRNPKFKVATGRISVYEWACLYGVFCDLSGREKVMNQESISLTIVGITFFFIVVKIYRNWIAQLLSRFLLRKGKIKLAMMIRNHALKKMSQKK